jgi:hypothetical protein
LIPFLLLAVVSWSEPGAYAISPPESTSVADSGQAEFCRFPVLCYHGVDYSGGLSVSPRRLLSDLESLYEAGFFLITPDDLENGLIQVPKDRSPLMITFDDGWREQFNMEVMPDGSVSIDSQSAVGILEAFSEDHPDFGRGAVFFLSWDKMPFGQEGLLEDKLNFLLDNGYVIGNHTLRHSSFMSLPRASWEEAIDAPLRRLRPLIGLRTFGVTAVSWPGGRLPKGSEADETVLSVSYEGSPAVRTGFVVDGDLASLEDIGGGDGRLRISRVDMGRFSVGRLLQLGGLLRSEMERSSLHDPLPWKAGPLSPLRLD